MTEILKSLTNHSFAWFLAFLSFAGVERGFGEVEDDLMSILRKIMNFNTEK